MEKLLFSLLRAEVCGRELGAEEKAGGDEELRKAVYKLAKRHDVAHIAGQALGKRGLLGDDAVSEKFRSVAMQAFFRHAQMENEYGCICRALEQAGIDFIPLKGAVLRQYYPESWMRNSCDIDILVRPENLDAAVDALQTQLGYTNKGRGDHDVSLYADTGVHLELHFDMMEDWYAAGDAKSILSRVWEDAAPVAEGSHHHVLSDPLFYFYHMAHMAKHFQGGGCGVRSFLDVWVLDNKVACDAQKRDRLLRDGGLWAFAQAARRVAAVWFDGEDPDDLTNAVSDFILRAGTFGNQENRAAVGQAQAGGKLNYLLRRRVFVPYEALKAEYPVLEKHKWLSPPYQVARWVRMLRQGKLRRAVKEWNTNLSADQQTGNQVADLLEELGLR